MKLTFVFFNFIYFLTMIKIKTLLNPIRFYFSNVKELTQNLSIIVNRGNDLNSRINALDKSIADKNTVL